MGRNKLEKASVVLIVIYLPVKVLRLGANVHPTRNPSAKSYIRKRICQDDQLTLFRQGKLRGGNIPETKIEPAAVQAFESTSQT